MVFFIIALVNLISNPSCHGPAKNVPSPSYIHKLSLSLFVCVCEPTLVYGCTIVDMLFYVFIFRLDVDQG